MPRPEDPRGTGAGVDLYWLPLGAGGWFVRSNGRLYERVVAAREHRCPRALFHTALVVRAPAGRFAGRFVVETAWPAPDAHPAARGVVREGPVLSRRLARFRVFRYEVRRWPDGVIADVADAVDGPRVLSTDPRLAGRLLALVAAVPAPAWGRDELGTGEMWNSNSVIAWLLARCGVDAAAINPPRGGRAPGWRAGVVVAARAHAGASGGARRDHVPAPTGPPEREHLGHRAEEGPT